MTGKHTTPLLAVGALFLLWGVVGLFDMGNIPYSGYLTGPDNTVIEVDEGSPADAAGLRVGDRVTSINGVSVEDTPALNRMPRAQIGETRTLVVEEAAETTLAAGEEGPATREVGITFAAQPGKYVALTWAGFIIGLCFLGFGLLAYVKAPSRSALLLAITGLCLGGAFLGGPYIASYALRTIIGTFFLMLVLLGFATLLHCLMEFPMAKAMLGKAHITKVLYAPAVLMALFFLWLIIFEPRGTSTLNSVATVLVGIFIVGYFGLALVALIHSFVKATPDERSKYGLNLMLAGVLIGLLPVTISALVTTFAPSVILPGSDFFFLTMVLIPITMALAVMRAGAAPAAEPVPVM
ncbi:MAG: PDZ domain-containing protein [Gemmatimonadetes bacterium]|nr:PDZ domain-containing protein [Gemmatimonadota bacterium]NIO31792.1 PDZ domain-containing protein [Gemmatimonadota bacterium]